MSQLIIQTQQQSEWCWAACAVSIARYFNPASTMRQCDVVDLVDPVQDCCMNPSAHNHPEGLTTAVRAVSSLRMSLDRALSFDELRAEIDAGRPVCAAIAWRSGGGHAVLITGYRVLGSGSQHVHVEDPLNPASDLDFDEFSNAYYGEGTWEATELLSVPGGQS